MPKKRILFITYHFPPFNGIASVRLSNMVVYLSELGWDITVLTIHPDLYGSAVSFESPDTRISEIPLKFIYTKHYFRSLVRHYLVRMDKESRLSYVVGGVGRVLARKIGIDPTIGWLPYAYAAVKSLYPDDYDLVLASGGPFTAFLVAEKAADYLKKPLVLDYRDPWTIDNPMFFKRRITKREKKIEKRILSKASHVICVSSELKKTIQDATGLNKISVITNGYNPREMESVKSDIFASKTILYTGTLHPPKRDMLPVFKALKSLKKFNSLNSVKWRMCYYGKNDQYVRELSSRYELDDEVEINGFKNRSYILDCIRSSDIFVVITSVYDESDPGIKGVVAGKIFEAIGLKKRILLISPKGIDAEHIINETNSGRRFSGNDTDGIAEYIKQCLLDEEAHTPGNIEKYSWDNLSLKYHEILQSIIC